MTQDPPAAPAWSLACTLEDRSQPCISSSPPHAPSPPHPTTLWQWTASSSGRESHVTLSYDAPHSWLSHTGLTFRWCLRLEVIFFLKDLRHQSALKKWPKFEKAGMCNMVSLFLTGPGWSLLPDRPEHRNRPQHAQAGHCQALVPIPHQLEINWHQINYCRLPPPT